MTDWKTRQGGCACGSVRYELTSPPLFVHVCHCTVCQQLTGSAFGMTMLVDGAAFNVIQGQPVSLALTGGSGSTKLAHRCSRCGSNLFGINEARRGCVAIRAGTLDETDWFTPQAHIWTRSKQAWVELPQGIPHFTTRYATEHVWPPASLQRLEEISQRVLISRE